MTLNDEKYSREVTLNCPTCGSTQFDIDDDTSMTTCTSCGRAMLKDELIELNDENIQAAKAEVVDEIAKDLKKEFKSIFKKWK